MNWKIDLPDSVQVALTVFPVGALTGLAMLLKDERKEIGWRQLISAILNSGLLSVCIYFLCFDRLGPERFEMSMALSIASGFGTNALIGAIIEAINLTIKTWIPRGQHGRGSNDESR